MNFIAHSRAIGIRLASQRYIIRQNSTNIANFAFEGFLFMRIFETDILTVKVPLTVSGMYSRNGGRIGT